MASRPFKVLIAGAGPTGLIAAHALGLAGIDFTILESRDKVAEDVGASLVLSPPTMRVMQQLGLFEALKAIGHELRHSKSFTTDGYVFRDNTELDILKKNHGISLVAFHRAELVQTLYDNLPHSLKENIKFGKKVKNIDATEDDVEVECADGSTYEGSILIGADGVHSKTRHLMRRLAQQSNLGSSWIPESPYVSSYKCLWCTFPRLTEPGESFDTQHKDSAVMYISGRERSWVFLYKKLPQPTQERVYYTDQDVEDFAAEFANYPVCENYKVRQVFAGRFHAGMSNLEEGIVPHWSMGRIVLVGDACHKFTPNAGLGFNNGLQDVVALCNGLQKAVLETPGLEPTSGSLTNVFKVYQKTRQKAVETDYSYSSQLTRMQAWPNTLYFLVGRYLSAYRIVDQWMVEYMSRASYRHGLVFEYLSTGKQLQGKLSWTYSIKSRNGE
ncbi:hypothetical protein NW761_007345 [Fusarium oxysporum]|nr:hypothetical protein NW758_005949 [Fusarium oxysporum]KAJ4089036.1 hypothetical protein NW761_007345 [Fusarium oxysporum]